MHTARLTEGGKTYKKGKHPEERNDAEGLDERSVFNLLKGL